MSDRCKKCIIIGLLAVFILLNIPIYYSEIDEDVIVKSLAWRYYKQSGLSLTPEGISYCSTNYYFYIFGHEVYHTEELS